MTSVTSSTRTEWTTRLAEALVEAGYETDADLQPAGRRGHRDRPVARLPARSAGTWPCPSVVVGTLAQLAQLPAVDLSAFTPQPEAAAALPPRSAAEFGAMALQFDGNALAVAFAEPPEPARGRRAGRPDRPPGPPGAGRPGGHRPAPRATDGDGGRPAEESARAAATATEVVDELLTKGIAAGRERRLRSRCTSTTCCATRCRSARPTSTSRRPCRAPSGSTARCGPSRAARRSTTRRSGT